MRKTAAARDFVNGRNPPSGGRDSVLRCHPDRRIKKRAISYTPFPFSGSGDKPLSEQSQYFKTHSGAVIRIFRSFAFPCPVFAVIFVETC